MFARQLQQSKIVRGVIGLTTTIALAVTSVVASTQDPFANNTTSQQDTGNVAAASTANLIVAGASHTCATLTNGEVRCWGDNNSGQLGDGSKGGIRFVSTAVRDINDPNAIIEAGNQHTCLMLNGGLKCFGSNSDGQLGIGFSAESTVPMDVPGFTSGVTYFAAGSGHSCAIKGGLAYCWGNNYYGALGNGETDLYNSYSPVQVVVITNVVSINAGAAHTCATLQNQSVYCWGSNSYGQLGNGTSDSCCNNVKHVTPTKVLESNSGATFVAAGGTHTCALMTDNTVQCWGGNNYGQIGNASSDYVITQPTPVKNLNNVANIIVGDEHTCALIKDGTVKCWGKNDTGQLGSNNFVNSNVPLDVPGLINVVQLTAGNNHTCARLSDGRVKCWGNNNSGQLGRGNRSYTANLNDHISGLTGETISALSVGSHHNCVVTATNQIKCWGNNSDGQLGDGTTTNRGTATPTYGKVSNFTQVSAGENFSCGLNKNGAIYCWGANNLGQLGNGSSNNYYVPIAVNTTLSATVLSAGANHVCAIAIDKTVQCWGNNEFGELGDGTTIMRSSPVSVVGLSNVKKIASGGSFTCAATEDGSAKCWGANIFGRLGLNSAIAMSTVPTNVVGISNVIDIAADAAHACAINSSGDVYCWGDNTYGQTSDLITHTVSAPIKVNGLPAKAASVATGYDNTCVILVTGQGHCWGRDNYAYKNGVSDISYDFYNIPQPIVVTAQSLASIELGRDHTCALGTNGAVMCWGSGQYFQTSFNNSNATPQYVLNIGGAQLAMPLVIKN